MTDWQPIESAPWLDHPLYQQAIMVCCEDGTEAPDSLTGIAQLDPGGLCLPDDTPVSQTGEDEGPGWEWWCEAPSRRVAWRPLTEDEQARLGQPDPLS